jgi:hypothetical protein
LSASTSISRLAALNRCQLTFLNFDVTDRIVERARGLLSGQLGRLDAAIRNVPLRDTVARGWSQLGAPIGLAPRTWLVLNPSLAFVSRVGGSGTTLQASVGLGGFPQIVYGDRPADSSVSLPARSDPPARQGFHIALEGVVSHAVASEELLKQLLGKRFYRGRNFIEVTGARVYGTGSDTAVVEIRFVGSAKGRVFFTGHPMYDNVTGVLSIPDLEFDVATKNVVLKLAEWLLHDDAREFVRQYARWNASAAVSQARRQLTAAINRELGPGLRLSGNLDAVTPLGVWVSPSEFSVRVRADGAVSLDVVVP